MVADRRTFLGGAAAAVAGLPQLGFLNSLPHLKAEDVQVDPKIVRLRDEIEPLVQLLEKTPRGEIIKTFAQQIGKGTSYKEILAALLLAGVRNVQPRPSVGFKFHAVLVVNSTHLASQAAEGQDRWLPLFWGLDNFKSSQSRDVQEGNWTMSSVDEAKVPASEAARGQLTKAIETWNVSAADVATAGLVRGAKPRDVFEFFARYGARDFRSIGHKAIFVANSWRALQTIGWEHAEPVLRSLTYAMLNHEGNPNPAQSDQAADRPWRENQKRAASLAKDWRNGKVDNGATLELIQSIREESDSAVCDLVIQQLNNGVAVQSIQDALFAASAEMIMQQPQIVAMHAVTTTNAIQFCFRETTDDLTRRLLLLQNAAFLPMFRDAMKSRGALSDLRIDRIGDVEGQATVDDIFDTLGANKRDASIKALSYLQHNLDPSPLIARARELVFLKGSDSHDYKFSSAILEDYQHVSPNWRNQYMAACTFKLKSSRDKDTSLIARTREALEKS
jgi:hypothetical protein